MDPWQIINSLKIKHYTLKDENLYQGNKYCKPFAKIKYLEDDNSFQDRNFMCNVNSCTAKLESLKQLEAHHKSRHTHFCITCSLTLPSHHLLDCHILEVHDSFFHILAGKKPMYSCLLETCKDIFNNAAERKKHCINKHNFPFDYRFDLQWKKLDTKPNKYFKKKNKLNDEEMVEVEGQNLEMETDSQNPNVLKSGPKTSKVPVNFSFGIGVPRSFNKKAHYNKGKHWHQRDKTDKTRRHIENINMKDIGESLE